MKKFLTSLAALGWMISPGLAEPTTPSATTALLTGKIHHPKSRTIELRYESSAHPGFTERPTPLDDQDQFSYTLTAGQPTAVQLNLGAATRPEWLVYLRQGWSRLFGGEPDPPLRLFVEPGDHLHVEVETGYWAPSMAFSGQGAANSQFFAHLTAEFPPNPDHYSLELPAFLDQIHQRRAAQRAFIETQRPHYALSAGLVDFVTRYVTYEWAFQRMFYPIHFLRTNGYHHEEITPVYYDFLKTFSLSDEKALGVPHYHDFLTRTMDWMAHREKPGRPKLSQWINLSSVGLSEQTQAALDSLFEPARPTLTMLLDFSASDLSLATLAQLDSLYAAWPKLKLSADYDLSAFGVSQAEVGRIDSLYAANAGYNTIYSSAQKAPQLGTENDQLVFRLPTGERLDAFKQTPALSDLIDLAAIGLPSDTQAQLDSWYRKPQMPALSALLYTPELDLSAAVWATLDSMYAASAGRSITTWRFATHYEQAKQQLEGRVLYWFLAGELIHGFNENEEGLIVANQKWAEFQAINPFVEYTQAVEAVLYQAVQLQPGQPAPDFTLTDLAGQKVSLHPFRDHVVFLDFWASWCGPCIRDLGAVQRIKEEMAGQAVVFINISLDTNEAAWRRVVERHQIQGIHLRATGFGSAVARAYLVVGLPSYFLVDPQGQVISRVSHISDTANVVAKIREHL